MQGIHRMRSTSTLLLVIYLGVLSCVSLASRQRCTLLTPRVAPNCDGTANHWELFIFFVSPNVTLTNCSSTWWLHLIILCRYYQVCRIRRKRRWYASARCSSFERIYSRNSRRTWLVTFRLDSRLRIVIDHGHLNYLFDLMSGLYSYVFTHFPSFPPALFPLIECQMWLFYSNRVSMSKTLPSLCRTSRGIWSCNTP